MPRSKIIRALGSALALSLGTSAVFAAGGGGGGSMGGGPSQSAPRYDAATEYRNGIEAMKTNDFKKAVRAFKRSISVAPRNANAQYLLGVSYLEMGSTKKARKPFEKAIKYNSGLIEAQRDLAITYHKLEMTDKSAATLTKLETQLQQCGDGCAAKEKLSKAVEMVRKAMNGEEAASLGLPHDFAEAQVGDGFYLDAVSLINEKRYQEALAELDRAGRTFGPHPDVLTYIGFANRKMRRFDVAEDYYRRALAVAPNHLGAIEYYGELKVERGDIKGANAHLARLEKLCAFGCYEAEELRRWINQAKRS